MWGHELPTELPCLMGCCLQSPGASGSPQGKGGVFCPALAAVIDLLSSKLAFPCLVPVVGLSPQRSLLLLDWRSSLPEPQGLNHGAGWVLVSPEKNISREGKVLCVSRECDSGKQLSAVELTQMQTCGCGLKKEK